MVVHIFLVCLYIFLSCHFICSNASYCWVFSVADFLLSLNMYHLITFQPFLKKTFCHMQSIQHQSEKKKFLFFFATVFFVIFNIFFFIAKRTMVLYNLNMVHLICKAYSKYNRNSRTKTSLVHALIAGIEVHLSFHPDFILCSVFTLKLFVLN